MNPDGAFDDDYDLNDSVQALVSTILRYLETHQMAGDSVTGVAQWWLGSAHPDATLDEVEAALGHLVDRKVLRRLDLSDGTTLYSSSPLTRQ